MHFFRSKALISTLFLFRNIASFVEIIEDGTRRRVDGKGKGEGGVGACAGVAAFRSSKEGSLLLLSAVAVSGSLWCTLL